MTASQGGSPFAQPEMPIPVPVQRAESRTKRYMRPVVALLVVTAIGFGGGFALAKATTPAATGRGGGLGNGQFGNGQFGPGASPGAGRPRGAFGGGATGTVTAVSADQMTVTTGAGAQRLVLLTPTTTV